VKFVFSPLLMLHTKSVIFASQNVDLKSVSFMFALEPASSQKDCTSTIDQIDISHGSILESYAALLLGIDKLHAIHHLCQGTPNLKDLSTKQIIHLVHTVSSEALTAEEHALECLPHSKLKQLSMWLSICGLCGRPANMTHLISFTISNFMVCLAFTSRGVIVLNSLWNY
jgi:hypothetical protein